MKRLSIKIASENNNNIVQKRHRIIGTYSVLDQITPDFTVRIATVEDGIVQVFALYKKWEFDDCTNEYMKAWIRTGRTDLHSKTITVITTHDPEWLRILIHTEIHGFLPEGFYDFGYESLFYLFGSVDAMEFTTFLSRLYFVETTKLFNTKKYRVYTYYYDGFDFEEMYQFSFPFAYFRGIEWYNYNRDLSYEPVILDCVNMILHVTLDHPIPEWKMVDAVMLDFHHEKYYQEDGPMFKKHDDLHYKVGKFEGFVRNLENVGLMRAAKAIKRSMWNSTIISRTNLGALTVEVKNLKRKTPSEFFSWILKVEKLKLTRGWFYIKDAALEKCKVGNFYNLIDLWNVPLSVGKDLEETGSNIWDDLTDTAYDQESRNLSGLAIEFVCPGSLLELEKPLCDSVFGRLHFSLPYVSDSEIAVQMLEESHGKYLEENPICDEDSEMDM